MAANHFLKLSVIAKFFDSKQLQRGENSVESRHVREIVCNLNVNPASVRGKVSASMGNKDYSVEVHIDKDDGIVKAKCGCPRGHISCHNMVLCVFMHDNVSITDTQCQWNIPKKPDDNKVQSLKDLYTC